MARKTSSDLLTIGDIYGGMLNHVPVVESTDKKVKGKLDIGKNDLQKGGPDDVDGYKKKVIDGDCDEDDENAYGAENTQDGEEDEEILSPNINTINMKKSNFDKLFEQFIGGQGGGVDQELDDLGAFDSGLDGGDDEGGGFGDEGEGEDEVTLSIPRSVAQQLLDLLKGVLETEDEFGGGDEFGDEGNGGLGDELEQDAFGGEEDEETLGTPLKGAKAPDMGKKNKVSNIKTSGGSAQSKVTDKVGDDGTIGHALKGAKQPDMGKQNKVGNLKTGKDFFNQ